MSMAKLSETTALCARFVGGSSLAEHAASGSIFALDSSSLFSSSSAVRAPLAILLPRNVPTANARGSRSRIYSKSVITPSVTIAKT